MVKLKPIDMPGPGNYNVEVDYLGKTKREIKLKEIRNKI